MDTSLPVSRVLLQKMVQALTALKSGFIPRLAEDGTGGTYMIPDTRGLIIACFKPRDEEAFAPNNPRGYRGKENSHSAFSAGICSTQCANREVSAFLLDRGFSGVPETTLVHARHPSFTNPDRIIWKTGSFQEFVDTRETAGNYHFSKYSVEDVQRIGLLDIRLLNTDRNDSNILVRDGSHRLIPIDHGMILPDCCEISEQDIVWMSWPQAKQKWTRACLDFIKALDIDSEAVILEKYNLVGEKSVRLMKCATLLLKIGAERGLTLFDIGQMLYRQKLEEPSVFEEILSRVSQRIGVARSLKPSSDAEWGCAFVKCVAWEIESAVQEVLRENLNL